MHVSELFDLTGRTAVVTGGATGLGSQMALALGEAGATVVICARKEARCVESAERLSEQGIRAIGMGCDVRDEAQVQEIVDRTMAATGRIDILVNNSGTTWGAPAEDVPMDGWRKVIDVNLTGSFVFAQIAGREMIEQGNGGKIVNIASIAAFRGMNPDTMDALPYNASKGGVIALTIDLAVKWAQHGIQVNAIAPGWFPSDLSSPVLEQSGGLLQSRVPLGRFGGEDDLKGAIVFLASTASDYVTGQTIVVDGGYLAT
jgi:gluconate 5-dehydrogenase